MEATPVLIKATEGAEILPSPVVGVEGEEVTLAPIGATFGRSTDGTNTLTRATSTACVAAEMGTSVLVPATAAVLVASGDEDTELDLLSHFFTGHTHDLV